MGRRKRRVFTSEQKAEAVRLVGTSGRSIADVARSLDLTETALRRWVEQANMGSGRRPGGALTADERQELMHLRRENKVLTQERDFLKKASAFFARQIDERSK
jgi:transposase